MCTRALTGCPARSGSSPPVTRRRIASWSASWYRCSLVRLSSDPAGAASASSTACTTDAAFGRQVAVDDPGALEGGVELDRPVLEVLVRVMVWLLRTQAGQDLCRHSLA